MEKYVPLDTSDRFSAKSLLNNETHDSSEDDNTDELVSKHQKTSWFARHKYSVWFNISSLSLNVVLCIGYTIWLQSRYLDLSRITDSPARSIITYEGKQLDLLPVYLGNGTLNPEKPTDFNGKPTPQLAEAWKNLMQYQNIRLQRDQLGPFSGDDSLVELSDGSGYFSTLAVFHGLHCVKRLHHYIHRDSYYPGLSEKDAARLLYHTEHCVDWLRQYVQCNADTTLIPFYWGTNQPSPLAVDKAKHQCISWKPLEKWMEKHSFDAFEPGLLLHPIYGNPYKKEKGDKIGIAVEDHVLQNGP